MVRRWEDLGIEGASRPRSSIARELALGGVHRDLHLPCPRRRAPKHEPEPSRPALAKGFSGPDDGIHLSVLVPPFSPRVVSV